MATQPKIKFLQDRGVAQIMHDSHVPFLTHLAGTRMILQQWGARQALCDGALFHSVYGTEFFTPDETVTIPTRSEVQELIGADAEEVAWLWCTIERTTLDPDTGAVIHRGSGATMTIDASRIQDLANLWAADIVEQMARMTADERGFARGAARLAAHMMPVARAAFEAVLAEMPCQA